MHFSIYFSFACPAYAETASCRQAKRKVTKPACRQAGKKAARKKAFLPLPTEQESNAWQAGALPHPLHIPESPALFVHNPPHLELFVDR